MQTLIKDLIQKNNTKIILIVLDGLGGLPLNGKTELDTAYKSNLDALAATSACGLHIPVATGITPGSGPGHLSLFGYDPLEWQIGRGVLEALGLGIELRKTDVAIRINYATIENRIIKDRRAGRIPTDESRKITERLQEKIKMIDGVETIFSPGMEHRFVAVLRFPEPLPQGAASIKDTDPQARNKPPAPVTPEHPGGKGCPVIEKLITRITEIIKNEQAANFILLRGFSQAPDIPHFEEAYGLKPLCIAVYPMYRGLAKLIGIKSEPALKGDVNEEIEFLKKNYNAYDFFFPA